MKERCECGRNIKRCKSFSKKQWNAFTRYERIALSTLNRITKKIRKETK